MIKALNNTNKWDPLFYLDQLMNHFILVTSTLDARHINLPHHKTYVIKMHKIECS
jgi:hypothetical protein